MQASCTFNKQIIGIFFYSVANISFFVDATLNPPPPKENVDILITPYSFFALVAPTEFIMNEF